MKILWRHRKSKVMGVLPSWRRQALIAHKAASEAAQAAGVSMSSWRLHLQHLAHNTSQQLRWLEQLTMTCKTAQQSRGWKERQHLPMLLLGRV